MTDPERRCATPEAMMFLTGCGCVLLSAFVVLLILWMLECP